MFVHFLNLMMMGLVRNSILTNINFLLVEMYLTENNPNKFKKRENNPNALQEGEPSLKGGFLIR